MLIKERSFACLSTLFDPKCDCFSLFTTMLFQKLRLVSPVALLSFLFNIRDRLLICHLLDGAIITNNLHTNYGPSNIVASQTAKRQAWWSNKRNAGRSKHFPIVQVSSISMVGDPSIHDVWKYHMLQPLSDITWFLGCLSHRRSLQARSRNDTQWWAIQRR